MKPANISQALFDKLRQWEGHDGNGVLTAYRDQGGVWTIGYGATRLHGRPVEPGDTLPDEKAAQDLLRTDLARYLITVYNAVKTTVNQCQFDALVSLCFNIGQAAFLKSSALRLVNLNPNSADVGKAMQRWHKITVIKDGQPVKIVSKGLVNRRRYEVQHYYSCKLVA